MKKSGNIKARAGRARRGESGQAIVEFAVALPILLLLVFGIIDFGWLFYNKMSVENASREGARYAIVNADKGTVAAEVAALAREYCMGSEADTSVTLAIAGDNATVTVAKQVAVLTPVAGIFVQGQSMEMTSTTTMRIN